MTFPEPLFAISSIAVRQHGRVSFPYHCALGDSRSCECACLFSVAIKKFKNTTLVFFYHPFNCTCAWEKKYILDSNLTFSDRSASNL